LDNVLDIQELIQRVIGTDWIAIVSGLIAAVSFLHCELRLFIGIWQRPLIVTFVAG